jgi:hypothetical protein
MEPSTFVRFLNIGEKMSGRKEEPASQARQVTLRLPPPISFTGFPLQPGDSQGCQIISNSLHLREMGITLFKLPPKLQKYTGKLFARPEPLI